MPVHPQSANVSVTATADESVMPPPPSFARTRYHTCRPRATGSSNEVPPVAPTWAKPEFGPVELRQMSYSVAPPTALHVKCAWQPGVTARSQAPASYTLTLEKAWSVRLGWPLSGYDSRVLSVTRR